MRAVALTPEGRLGVVDKPEPTPGPADVIVAVERCGICGSDLHMKASGLLPPGTVMGHEFAGTIADRGEEAPSHLREGQRVSVLPAVRCGTCELCAAGKGHLCAFQAATSIGLGMNDGAYAEYVRTPAVSCFPLPDDMTPEQGALVEPYAVGLHAVARSRVKPGMVVGIIGAGPIGLMCLAALRDKGIEEIVVAERSEPRAAIAEAMGASVARDANRLPVAGPFDVVFDAAGVSATAPIALEAAKSGGQIVVVGVVNPGETLDMPGLLWVVKEVDVLPSMAYTTDEFAAAVERVAAGAVDPALVVSDVRPLEAADRSFEDLATSAGPVKIMLSP